VEIAGGAGSEAGDDVGHGKASIRRRGPAGGAGGGASGEGEPRVADHWSKSRLTSPEVAYLIRRAEVAPRRRAAKRTTVAGSTPHIEIRSLRTVR